MTAGPPLRGVIPVLETPFGFDGDPDRDGFVRLVEHVIGTGVRGVMFPGYASEVLKLNDRERGELIGDLLGVTNGRPNVAAVVSVPDHATKLAVDWACGAVANGADAINVLPPYLLEPSTAQVLDHLHQVAAAVAPVPVVVQFAPRQTGTALTADDLVSLASAHGNVVAVKVESNPPVEMITDLRAAGSQLEAWVGSAGLYWPEAARCGAVAVQPGCSFVEVYVELARRWEAGDVQGFDDLHAALRPFLAEWMQHVELIVQVEKHISVHRGLISSAFCRAPGVQLDTAQRATIDRFLVEFEPWLPGA
jgi:dihydrodipicolinate synthase/N-acetylneuraminate lyase